MPNSSAHGTFLELDAETEGEWVVEHWGFRPNITTALGGTGGEEYQMMVTLVRSREIRNPTSFRGLDSLIDAAHVITATRWDGAATSKPAICPFTGPTGERQKWRLLAHYVDRLGPPGSGDYREVQEWVAKDQSQVYTLSWG